jgi:hypothetical protein
VRLKGLGNLEKKNPLTSSGFKPATVWLVAYTYTSTARLIVMKMVAVKLIDFIYIVLYGNSPS